MNHPWYITRNYFELLSKHENYEECNNALCILADSLYSAVIVDDYEKCKEIAKQFDKLQEKYEDVGASDTEPRIHMSDIVHNAASSVFLVGDKINQVADWFRWWYNEEEEDR